MDWKEDLVITKDPGTVAKPIDIDWMFNWAEWLGTDTIASAEATVESGLGLLEEANTTTTHTIWLTGGTAETSYVVTSRIVTANSTPRRQERSVTVYVSEK